jgi:hypothetical protein
MIPSLLLVCIALLGAGPAHAAATVAPAHEPVEIRVGTYNIWGLPGPLTKPRWRHRRGLVNRFLGKGASTSWRVRRSSTTPSTTSSQRRI